MATSTLVTVNSKVLQRLSFIQYLVQFKEDQPKVLALINFGSKVNAITAAHIVKLGLIIQETSVKAQKIDGLPIKTYGIVSTSFLLQDSLKKVQFFEETFLLADTSMKMVLGMPFLSLSNADVEFAELKKTT